MTNHYHLLVEILDGNLSNIAAFQSDGKTQKEIDEYFGLHYSRISRIAVKRKTCPHVQLGISMIKDEFIRMLTDLRLGSLTSKLFFDWMMQNEKSLSSFLSR